MIKVLQRQIKTSMSTPLSLGFTPSYVVEIRRLVREEVYDD